MAGEQFPFRPEWPYWNATRIIPGTINEFPFFSYLYGDLHAHVIALPLTVLALLLLVALWRGRDRGRWLRLSLVAALGFVVGALRATNTWDYPTYAALAGVGGVIVTVQSGAGMAWRRRWLDIGLVVVTLGVTMLALWTPFTRYLATGNYGKLMLVAGESRMTIRDLVVMYGLWLWVLVPFGFVVARRVWSRRTVITGSLAIVGWMLLTRLFGATMQPRESYLADGKIAQFINDLVLEPLRQSGAAIIVVLPLFVVAVALLIAALRGRTKRREALPLAWLVAALGLILLAETIVLPGAGRMNVVFKFGYSAWTLLALAAATALPTVLGRTATRGEGLGVRGEGLGIGNQESGIRNQENQESGELGIESQESGIERQPVRRGLRARQISARHSDPRSPIPDLRPSPLRLTWATIAVLLMLVALLYPLTATPAKVADRYVPDAPRGLDGMAWMDTATWNENGEFSLAADAAAIRWIRANVPGTPTILEASTSPYRWNSRIATWTGLPTLIGWDGHQNQQRDPARAGGIIGYRKTVIEQIYNAADGGAANRLLDAYGIGALYVGPLERNLYGANAGQKFAELGGGWRLAYDQADAKVYLRTTPAPRPTHLPTNFTLGEPAADPVANVSLAVPTGELAPVDGVADWVWLGQHQWAAILLWLLVFQVLGLLAWPIAALALRSHGAAAWGMSKIIGLLLVGWLIWLPTSLGLWRWTRASVVVGLLMLAGLSYAAWRYGAAARIRATLRLQRRAFILTEAVFLGLFAAWTLLRAANPDLWHPYWGGEKPFEAGFLNAILRSPNMAPIDPFFSGGTINYYYYGLYLMSIPMKLLGLDSAIGFNLAVATVGALIGVGAWSVGLLVLRRLRVAALALVVVALLGNLASAIPVGGSSGTAGLVRAFQACDLPSEQPRPGCVPVNSVDDVNLSATISDALSNGTLAGFSRRLGSGVPWFWGPSRVLVQDPLVTINEFPLWSIIFADLHPHLIALPLTLLVIALAWEASRRRRWRGTWPTLVLLPFVLGALAPSNAWDVPTYGLLVVFALVLRGIGARGQGRGARGSGTGSGDQETGSASFRLSAFGFRLFIWALAGVGLIVAGLLLYAPFLGAYKAPIGGVWPIRIGSGLLPWLAIYGLFLLVIVGWLMMPRRRTRDRGSGIGDRESGIRNIEQSEEQNGEAAQLATPIATADSEQNLYGVAAVPAAAERAAMPPSLPLLTFVRRLRPRWLLPYALASFALVLWYVVRTEPMTFKPILTASFGVRFVLIALLALLVPRLLRRTNHPGTRWALLLATVGALVALGSEMVFIRDHLAPQTWQNGPNNSERMNTVFKFGYQVWVLWALAAALLLPHLLRGLRRTSAVMYGVWLGVLSILVAAALVFPIFGPISRAGTRFERFPIGLTLDGLAWMDTGSYNVNNGTVELADDHAAIRWINANIRGTPVLLQSEQEFYRAYGIRIAANTGLPTVISALHSSEQRPASLVDERVRDVQRIYNGSDPAETYWLLNKYNVKYVYVGQIERLRDPVGVKKFDTMTGLQSVYTGGTVTIYQATPQLPDLALQWRPIRPNAPDPDTITIEPIVPDDALAAALTKYENDPTNAGNAFDVGVQLWRVGQGERAAGILRTAADLHPTDIGLHHVLGDVLLSLGRYEEGVLAYQQGFDTGSTPQNLNKLGSGYLEWGKVDPARLTEAERVLREAIALDNTLPDPHYQLGETYRLLGDNARARAEYEEYLRRAPPDAIWVQASKDHLAKLQ